MNMSVSELKTMVEERRRTTSRWQADWMDGRDKLPAAATRSLMDAGATELETTTLETDLRNAIIACEESAERMLSDLRGLMSAMDAVDSLAAEVWHRRLAAGGFIIN